LIVTIPKKMYELRRLYWRLSMEMNFHGGIDPA
jgi:hypothetical protein